MTRTQLSCRYCGDPIRKKDAEYTEITIHGTSSAYHHRCHPNWVPPDTPFQAAIQKAKQAIEDARRLGAEPFAVFCEVVEIALKEQR